MQRSLVNETPTYRVSGEQFRIVPENFRTNRVIDFGVSGNGSLSYDPTFDEFVFDPNGQTGIFEVYWIVNREVTQAAGNASNATNTTMVSTEYTARIEVQEQASLLHTSQERLSSIEEDAENWQEFENTVLSPGVAGEDADIQEVTQNVINLYRLANDPLAALTGNFTGVIILIVTTLGGLLFWALWNGHHTVVTGRLYRRLNIHESIEAEEGELGERIEELD